MAEIHPTAIVDRDVQLSDGVRIGAYAVVRGRVTIGAGTILHEHTVVNGTTVIGKDCRLGPAAYVGMDPQHVKYKGEETWLVMGDGVTIRETASVHRSFRVGMENATRLGDRCYLMGASHVGHDCVLGNDVTMANAAMLGGHVVVGDRAFMGGGSIMHQFVRVGRLAIVAGNEGINRDVPPFAAVRFDGLKAYNAIGVKRAGLAAENVRAIRQAYQKLHTYRKMPDAVRAIREEVADTPEVKELLEFIASAKRGVLPSWGYVRGAGMGEEV